MPSISKPNRPRPQRPARIKPRRPQRDTGALPDPMALIEDAAPSTGNAEKDLTAEQWEIKKQLQAQDKAQRQQFKNIYDTAFYYADCFATRADRDRAQRLQAKILGVGGDDVSGLYRDGYVLLQAWEQLAQRLGVDVD